ncbi:MAG: tRNA (adenosine(37)-N6)-threonylcarbamoyltransferase complex transferase subunit TsaD [Desulfobacteraceae bacterium]|nr:tRNA (adenosine(37)-N6)-threonylcarbamoyltransferase complex transferase subunit TsaD [Desulfobacteraceae bacterium]
MIVLGIETSCDETAAAIVESGSSIKSSIVASQVSVHHTFGGVVPELASRMHMEAIVPVVEKCLDEAGLTVSEIDAVAATQGPGLAGALLVGFCFAKALAFTSGKPLVGVDHLEGHLQTVSIDSKQPCFPMIGLLASGGHTGIYYLKSQGDYQLLGQTRDDAAGEAYDKVAKMLGLGYPGGAVIDDLAHQGNPEAIYFKRPYVDKQAYDFSFSGIKTAVMRYLQSCPKIDHSHRADIAAGFQEAVVDVLVYKVLHAAKKKNCSQIAVVGGVAANKRLRTKLSEAASREKLTLRIPPLSLCGDNAAMIAAVGYHNLKAGKGASLDADAYSRQIRPKL